MVEPSVLRLGMADGRSGFRLWSLFGLVAALKRRLDRVFCGLRGHMMLMRFEPGRLTLRCAWCGCESRGWEVTPGGEAVNRSAAGHEPRPAVVRQYERRPAAGAFEGSAGAKTGNLRLAIQR